MDIIDLWVKFDRYLSVMNQQQATILVT